MLVADHRFADHLAGAVSDPAFAVTAAVFGTEALVGSFKLYLLLFIT